MKMLYVVSEVGHIVYACFERAEAEEVCAEYNRAHRFFDFYFHVKERDEEDPIVRC